MTRSIHLSVGDIVWDSSWGLAYVVTSVTSTSFGHTVTFRSVHWVDDEDNFLVGSRVSLNFEDMSEGYASVIANMDYLVDGPWKTVLDI